MNDLMFKVVRKIDQNFDSKYLKFHQILTAVDVCISRLWSGHMFVELSLCILLDKYRTEWIGM